MYRSIANLFLTASLSQPLTASGMKTASLSYLGIHRVEQRFRQPDLIGPSQSLTIRPYAKKRALYSASTILTIAMNCSCIL